MKRIMGMVIAICFLLCIVPVSSYALAGDYAINIIQCEENEGAIVVSGAIVPSLEYGLKMTIRDGSEVKHTALVTSNSDGSFEFDPWTAPQSTEDKNYTVTVEAVDPDVVYSGFNFSDDFSSAPTTSDYTVVTTQWDEENECVVAQASSSRARLIKDFDGNKSNGVSVIELDVIKKEKTASSRLYRSMGINGEVTAFTVSCDGDDIVAKAGAETETLVLAEDYDVDTFYNIKSINYIQTKRVEFFVDGEYKGVLSYSGYNDAKLSSIYRVFDTSSEVGDGAHYIDNLSIKYGTSAKKWVDSDTENITIFRSTLTSEVVNAIDNATSQSLWNDLAVFTELDLDETLLERVGDNEKAAEIMLSGNNNSISAVRKNYVKSVMIQLIREDSDNAASIIDELAAESGIDTTEFDTEDTQFIELIQSGINSVDTMNAFDVLLEKSGLCSKLMDAQYCSDAVANNEDLLMESYGLSEKYMFLSDADKVTASVYASGYSYGGESIDEAIENIVSLINEKTDILVLNVPVISGNYNITIEDCVSYENIVKIKGNIGVEAQYKILVEIKNGQETVYTKEMLTKTDGTFEHECTLPLVAENVVYDINVKPVEPTVSYTTEYVDDFSQDVSGNYLVYRGVDRDEEFGNTAPSIKVSYEVSDSNTPRILFSSETLRNKFKGEVCVQADILKKDKSVSEYLLRSMEYTGNHSAYTILSDNQKIYAQAPSGTLTLVPDYSINKWYTLRANIDLNGKRIQFYVNDIYRGMLSYKSQEGLITDVGRAFDTGVLTVGNSHYVDNVYVLNGTYSDEKFWINPTSANVTVYGTNYTGEALDTVNGATSATLVSKIQTYNQAFNIDLSLLDGVVNKDAAAELILSETASTITDLRENYIKGIMIQLIKENPAQLKEIITTYSKDANADVSDINLDSTVFSQIVNTTISSVTDIDGFDTLMQKAEIESNLLDATKLTAGSVFADYENVLLDKYGLSSLYSSLSDDHKDGAAQAVFSRTYTNYEATALMTDMIAAVNSYITSLNTNVPPTTTITPSGGFGGGGGGGGGSAKPSQKEETVTPDGSENITAEKFADVNKEHWAYHSIVYLADKGILNGRGDGGFSPDDTVKREEFVKILVLAKNLNVIKAECSFNDVDENSWYFGYIAAAVQSGIISGISETEFGSGLTVSREDAAVMISRALGTASGNNNQENVFTDSADISSYAKDAVNRLYNDNVISGMGDGSFMPKKMLTRAEAAQLIFKALYE